MKKFFLLILLLLMSACSPEPDRLPCPIEPIMDFLTYIQSGEFTEAHKLTIGESPLYQIEEEYRVIFQNLSYRDRDITGIICHESEEAEVILTISTVDFAAVMEDVMEEAFPFVFMDITVADLLEMVSELMLERMLDEAAPIVSNEVTVYLELHEGQWKIIVDENFADAVTGGMLSFARYVEEW